MISRVGSMPVLAPATREIFDDGHDLRAHSLGRLVRRAEDAGRVLVGERRDGRRGEAAEGRERLYVGDYPGAARRVETRDGQRDGRRLCQAVTHRSSRRLSKINTKAHADASGGAQALDEMHRARKVLSVGEEADAGDARRARAHNFGGVPFIDAAERDERERGEFARRLP